MSTLHVVWEPFTDGCSRGFWDQAIVEQVLAGRWRPPAWPTIVHHDTLDTLPAGAGAVVVVPARHHAAQVDELNGMLARLPWCLLILTGDEEGTYPVDLITHPNRRIWVQTPRPDRVYPDGVRWLPNGPTPGAYGMPWGGRTLDVAFAGQITHERRTECADAVRTLQDAGRPVGLHLSAGFGQGLPQAEYLEMMASAKVCPAPSGPVHVDSFRAWEALELGAVPILDVRTPPSVPVDHEWVRYWVKVMTGAPAMLVADWADLPELVDEVTGQWPYHATRAAAWWIGCQRRLAQDLLADLDALTGQPHTPDAPDDVVTVLVPTSPIPSHPSTWVIEKTIDSVRAQLPDAEILIMCDGPNPIAEARRADYEDYLHELVRLCRESWHNVLPIVHDTHLHQSGMTQHALDLVTTPQVLFVEHDTPLGGVIDWDGLTRTILDGEAGVIRLHHEALIHPEHLHLTLGPMRPVGAAGVPLVATVQWSQRPHLADADLYRRMLVTHLAGHDMMIEDKMHSVVQVDWALHGMAGWERWRLFVYAPEGTEHGIKRSWHTDGRGTDAKWIGS